MLPLRLRPPLLQKPFQLRKLRWLTRLLLLKRLLQLLLTQLPLPQALLKVLLQLQAQRLKLQVPLAPLQALQ